MKLNFRNLRADEIDVRVGTAKSGGKGISLVLYKDARCDMNILDEIVGPMNWKREHTRDNANCIVSILDSEKNIWVSKEDVGTAGNIEKEKSLASDSFKRACTNWGIGRQLYTAPFIWVSGNADVIKDYKYIVYDIDYDKYGNICYLVIRNHKGENAFTFGKKGSAVERKDANEHDTSYDGVDNQTEDISGVLELVSKAKSAQDVNAIWNEWQSKDADGRIKAAIVAKCNELRNAA